MYVKEIYSKVDNKLISYELRVSGKNPINNKRKYYNKRWTIPTGLTNKTDIKRELEKFKVEFEENCRKQSQGLLTKSEKQCILLQRYSNDWLEDILVRRPQAFTYYVRQKENIKVINDFFGPKAILNQIDITDCKRFYTYLCKRKYTKKVVKVKSSIADLIEEQGLTKNKVAQEIGIARLTLRLASTVGNAVSMETAKSIATYFKVPLDKYFSIELEDCNYAKSVNLSVKTTLIMLFNEAINDEIIQINYAQRAYKNQFEDIEVKEVITLDKEEALSFVENLSNEQDLRKKSVYALFIFLGLRKAELCGLEWKDIDFDKNIIRITRNSVYAGKEFGVNTKSTKTTTSKRENVIPDVLREVLQEYQIYWNEQKSQLKGYGEWAKTDRLFVQANGKPINPSVIRQWITKYCNMIGITRIPPKSFRHTAISLMLNEVNIPLKVVSQKVGHADVKITFGTYAHANRDEDIRATRAYNDFLCGK